MQKEKKQKRWCPSPSGLVYALPISLLLSILLLGACAGAIPDDVYYDSVLSSESATGVSAEVSGNDAAYTAKLFGFLPAKNIDGKLSKDLRLIPGGDVFGVKFFTKGVVVTDMSEVESDEGIICPAAKA